MTSNRIKVLVTGANGFLGSNAVSFLRKYFKVSCLVRDSKFNHPDTFYFHNYDDASVEKAVSESDVIVHIASMIHGNKEKMYSANVKFTEKLVELSKKHRIRQFIYISTENVNQGNKDIYTKTKKAAEDEVKRLKNHTILRPTVIYGPGDRKYVTKLIGIIKRFPVIPVLGKGNNKFQFVYVDDVCRIIESSIKNKIYGTYVVAGPESISYNDFMVLLMNELKVKKPVIRIPVFILKPISHMLNAIFSFPPLTPSQLDNLSKNRNYDIRKIVKIFKYKPTPLKEGIRKLIKEDF